MDVDNLDQDDEARRLFEERAEESPQGETLADRLTKPRPESTVDLQGEPEQEAEEADIPAKVEAKEQPQPEEKPRDEVDIQALAKAVARMSSGLDGLNGKFGGLSQKFQELERERAARQTAGSVEQPTQTQVTNAATALVNDDPEWDSFKEEFPQMAKAIERRFGPALNALQQQPKEVVKEVFKPDPRIEELVSRDQERVMREQIDMVRSKHPDFAEVAASDAFNVFVSGLPDEVRAYKDSKKAKQVNFLLDLYKKETGLYKPAAALDDSKEKRLRSAVQTTRGQAQGRRSVLSEDDMSPEELFEHRAREEERRLSQARR